MSTGFVVLFTIAVFGTCVSSGNQECPANSRAVLCGSVCEPTCKHPIEIACRVDPRTCTTDCRCLGGFVKNTETNDCVKVEDCPGSSTTTATSSGGDNSFNAE